MTELTEFQRVRREAGVSQNEAAVRARVSPPTARLFEKFGPSAVGDEVKRRRLETVYSGFSLEAARRSAA